MYTYMSDTLSPKIKNLVKKKTVRYRKYQKEIIKWILQIYTHNLIIFIVVVMNEI